MSVCVYIYYVYIYNRRAGVSDCSEGDGEGQQEHRSTGIVWWSVCSGDFSLCLSLCLCVCIWRAVIVFVGVFFTDIRPPTPYARPASVCTILVPGVCKLAGETARGPKIIIMLALYCLEFHGRVYIVLFNSCATCPLATLPCLGLDCYGIVNSRRLVVHLVVATR